MSPDRGNISKPQEASAEEVREHTATETSPLLGSREPQQGHDSTSAQSSLSATKDGQDNHSTSIDVERNAGEESEVSQIQTPKKSPIGVWKTLSVLLIGVFVSQLDQSLVLATYGRVATEFHELESGSWLISAYILAQCASQPLYGKLSDIYHRKSCLIASYVLFAVGTAGTGQARSMAEAIAWRAIQGAGGAGMVSMVSIIITDLVPQKEVASMRSYVNVLQTLGRSCGGVIGGALTQAIGWRWAFLVQVPPTLLAIPLVAYGLHLPSVGTKVVDDTRSSRWAKLKRIDFLGAFFLTSTILAACLILTLGGQRLPWNSLYIFILVGITIVFAAAFVISARFAREPIFPLRLFVQQNVIANYAVIFTAIVSQISLMSSVPVYLQITQRVGPASSGAYLIPAFAGNTVGGLLAGYWIKRTGRHKIVTIVGPLSSILCMLLLLFTWDGHITIPKSLAIFPGGFAAGAVSASTFVSLIAGVAGEDVAVAASGMYLFFNAGAIAGVSAGSAASQTVIRRAMQSSLDGYSDKAKIIESAISNIDYVWTLRDKHLRNVLIEAYVKGFRAVNVLGILSSSIGLLFALVTKGTELDQSPRGEE